MTFFGLQMIIFGHFSRLENEILENIEKRWKVTFSDNKGHFWGFLASFNISFFSLHNPNYKLKICEKFDFPPWFWLWKWWNIWICQTIKIPKDPLFWTWPRCVGKVTVPSNFRVFCTLSSTGPKWQIRGLNFITVPSWNEYSRQIINRIKIITLLLSPCVGWPRFLASKMP